jgi:hypothetical protein
MAKFMLVALGTVFATCGFAAAAEPTKSGFSGGAGGLTMTLGGKGTAAEGRYRGSLLLAQTLRLLRRRLRLLRRWRLLRRRRLLRWRRLQLQQLLQRERLRELLRPGRLWRLPELLRLRPGLQL